MLHTDYALPIDAEAPVAQRCRTSSLVPFLLRCNSIAFGALSGGAYCHGPEHDRRPLRLTVKDVPCMRQLVRRCHPHPGVVSGDGDS
jgi:hypothetical protein